MCVCVFVCATSSSGKISISRCFFPKQSECVSINDVTSVRTFQNKHSCCAVMEDSRQTMPQPCQSQPKSFVRNHAEATLLQFLDAVPQVLRRVNEDDAESSQKEAGTRKKWIRNLSWLVSVGHLLVICWVSISKGKRILNSQISSYKQQDSSNPTLSQSLVSEEIPGTCSTHMFHSTNQLSKFKQD